MMKKIYILHGWTYSLDKWTACVGLFKEAGFAPVLLKIPGLTAPSNQVWDLDKYSGWLKEKLGRERGKVILLGHSNGGRIAAYFAAKHPEKVSRLILVDAAGIYHRELSLQIKRFIFKTVVGIGKIFTSSEFLKNFLYFLVGERDYQKAAPNMKATMVNLSRFDLAPLLWKIKTPTLIIWGETDKITPLADGKLMKKSIPHSELKIIKGARHSPFYTHPKEVVKIIKNGI
jgi:pimeloyl-ACP methyl ester carboxylesterase